VSACVLLRKQQKTLRYTFYGVLHFPAGRTVHTNIPQVQNYAAKHRSSARQNICESLRVISVKHSSLLPDDGSNKIRNMSE